MSLESQMKRHILAEPHSLLVFHPSGFQDTCAREIKRCLGDLVQKERFSPAIEITPSGIRVSQIHYRNILELALRLRTARDIYWILAKGRAASVTEVRKRIAKVPWKLILPENLPVSLRVASRASRLNHEGLLSETAAEVLTSLGFSVAKKEGEQLIDIRLDKNQLQVGLSVSGGSLFHRGYKTEMSAPASIREDLAACLIQSAFDWLSSKNRYFPSHVLCPFAGSGTLGFESLLSLTPLPHTLFRSNLACLQWLPTSAPAVRFIEQALLRKAGQTPLSEIVFLEKSAASNAKLKQTIRSFTNQCKDRGVEVSARTETTDFLKGTAAPETGKSLFLPLNPPYGRRLKTDQPLRQLYHQIGSRLESMHRAAPGSHLAGFVLAPSNTCESACGDEMTSFTKRSSECTHGGTKVRVLSFSSAPVTKRSRAG